MRKFLAKARLGTSARRIMLQLMDISRVVGFATE